MTDNRHVLERLQKLAVDRDVEGIAELLHPDIVVKYPQSGEVFRGKDNVVASLSNYPQELPDVEVEETHGGEQSVEVATPIPFAIPTITVTGSGDTFFVEGEAGPYPDGIVYKTASILTFRDGKLSEQTDYFAAPFDPPEWRRPFVEQ